MKSRNTPTSRTASYRRADALRRWYDMSLDPSTVDTHSQVDPAWVKRVLIDDTAAQDWPSLLSRLSAPVLLLLGAYDFVVPPVLWDKEIHVAKLTKEVLPRSGHQPFFDEPERFVAAISEWLQRNDL
jgi:proline iminopeptidase